MLDSPPGLDDLSEGVLLIGEATAWRDHRALGEGMFRAAARGVPVLCLAPGEGSTELPGAAETDLPQPDAMSFHRGDFIREFDKRLDADWPEEEKTIAGRLSVQSDRGRVVVAATQDKRDWAWLDVRFPHPHGRLLVCGLPIMRQWEARPTPRYLLSDLLEKLSPAK